MASVLFIVWRESLEAVLIIGILYAYLMRFPHGRQGLKFLWGGISGGIGLSVLLALATLHIQDDLQGQRLQYFQTGMLLVAAALMTQMVLWMHKYGHTLKRNLESDMDKALSSGRLLGVSVVALLAVAREGAETVLYLYSLGLEHKSGGLIAMFGAAVTGFVLALVTAWVVSKGVRFLSYRTFFRVTGIILLFAAAGLLMSGVSNLIGMGVLPALMEPIWNTSIILDSNSRVGAIVAALTGYRSQPSLMLVLFYALYWTAALGWMKWRRGAPTRMREESQPSRSSA